MPQYRFVPETGLWRHVRGQGKPPMSLHDIDYSHGSMRYVPHIRREPESALAGYLRDARAILAGQPDDRPVPPHHLTDEVEALRWFWLPEEIAQAGAGTSTSGPGRAAATNPAAWPG
jgi:hypothetical protein